MVQASSAERSLWVAARFLFHWQGPEGAIPLLSGRYPPSNASELPRNRSSRPAALARLLGTDAAGPGGCLHLTAVRQGVGCCNRDVAEEEGVIPGETLSSALQARQ